MNKKQHKELFPFCIEKYFYPENFVENMRIRALFVGRKHYCRS